jgi:hypothetical protein
MEYSLDKVCRRIPCLFIKEEIASNRAGLRWKIGKGKGATITVNKIAMETQLWVT